MTNPMRKAIQWLLVVLAVGCVSTNAQVPVTVHPEQQVLLRSDDPHLAANKRLIFDFLREVVGARNMALAPQYMAEDYIQHDPNMTTGRQPFIDFFGRFERRPVPTAIDNLVAMLAEGDLVVLVFRRELPDPSAPAQTYTTTWYEMFRLKDGRIAEHWDDATRK